jgi:hypothetical protein
VAQFIPSFHFVNPSEKLKPEWCKDVVHYYWFNTSKTSLLDGKRVGEIEGYASGEFTMEPFKRMYKSIKKTFQAEHPDFHFSDPSQSEEVDAKMYFEPLPLIPAKLNAAVSVLQKVPVEVSVTAMDPLAAQKKKEDLNFLKNKPKIEAEMQSVADDLQLEKVDLGATKHSFVPYSSSPYGIDLEDEEEADIFVNIIYNLGVEVSFETAIQIFYDIKKWSQLRKLKIEDQYKFGVSCHSAFISPVTGLPDQEYIHPQDVYVPHSKLPDFSDTTYRVTARSITAMELFNFFPDEIKSEDDLEKILNDKTNGYCSCNGMSFEKKENWETFKVSLLHFEVRSVDWIGVVNRKGGKGFSYLTTDSDLSSERIWGQNTYSFYCLQNTDHFFDIHRLPFAHRTKGQESIQNFTTYIYKSQERSAVELSVKANKKAQIADIKMQYAILMSLPAGKYIDLRFLRNAIDGLTNDEEDNPAMKSQKYTMDTLLHLALTRNQFIGDTEGFDGKNDGQFKPFMDIPGGIKTEIDGYRVVIADAKRDIADFTGINDALTGQGADPDALIGLERLRINSSLNALYYAREAISDQEEALIQLTANGIKSAIESGGRAKKAIINMIGDRKVDIIDRLDEVPIHNLGVKVSIKQREEERARYEARLARLKDTPGIISVADEYMLDAITNPKDKIALLAIREKQYIKRLAKQREEDAKTQQQLIAANGQSQVQVQAAKDEGKIKQIYAQGDVQAKITQLAGQLGMNAEQFRGLVKKMLQDDRNTSQREKSLAVMEKKKELERTDPLV